METRPLTPPSPEEARALRDSLLAGNPPSLESLRDFILRAQNSLTRDRRAKDTPSDVDFF